MNKKLEEKIDELLQSLDHDARLHDSQTGLPTWEKAAIESMRKTVLIWISQNKSIIEGKDE